jgi:hypothetical protein
MRFCLFWFCTDRVALVEEDNKRDLLGTDRIVEVLDELIHGGGYIHEQDRPVHAFPDDPPGKLEPLLPRGAVQVDSFFTDLHPAVIERDGRGAPGALGLDMLCLRVKRLDQRGLSDPERTKNDNIVLFFAITLRWK